MSSEYPYLEIQTPDGTEYVIHFKNILKEKQPQEGITIGRLDHNDIVLSDPQRTISRQHCCLKLEAWRWWLVDENSANGTFLQRSSGQEEIDVRWDGQVKVKDGDKFLILGKISAENEPIFWQLTFRDPSETRQVINFDPPVELEYSLSQEKLLRVIPPRREEIKLTPQEATLIHYMAQRNWDNHNLSVVCRHEELIEAIWRNSFGWTKNAVTRLVWGIRNKIETDSGEPQFLQTVRGQGYRLEIKILN